MAGPMPVFREIHRLRGFIHNLQEQLDRIPRLRKAHQARLAKQEQALREAQEAIRKLKVTASDKEKSLKATNGQITRYEQQVNLVSSKKEFDALQLEIAHARTTCEKLEDEILQALVDVDEKTAQLPGLEKALAQVKDEVAKFEAESAPRQADWAAQQAETRKQLQAAEANVPAELRPQYNRTIASLDHEGMAAVKDRTCTACYTEIIYQDFAALELDAFVICKSCGRILYLPASMDRTGAEEG
jgi:predicted  nucleic acid-binding Zn-ribbon protein